MLVNVTVDDNVPDPRTGVSFQYSPGWNLGPDCNGCTAKPCVENTYGRTWHDSTYLPPGLVLAHDTPGPHYVTFNFTGSAIYVFGVLSHSFRSPRSWADISFYIDDALSSTFTFTPSGKSVYSYNIPLYVNSTLEHGAHVLKLQNGRVGGNVSLVLLDYITYSTEDRDKSTNSSPSANTPATTSPVLSTNLIFPPDSASSTTVISPATMHSVTGSSLSDSHAHRDVVIALACFIPVLLALITFMKCYLFRQHKRTKHRRRAAEWANSATSFKR